MTGQSEGRNTRAGGKIVTLAVSLSKSLPVLLTVSSIELKI